MVDFPANARILFIGHHFPRPNNKVIGTWAIDQLDAMNNMVEEVRAISPVPLVPSFIGRVLGKGSSHLCPDYGVMGRSHIKSFYPRWPIYPVGPLKHFLFRFPAIFLFLAWNFIKGDVCKIHEDFKPTHIFAHHGAMGGYIASKLSEIYGTPYFITEHSFGEIESCARLYFRRKVYKSVIKRAELWVAVASRMASAMRRQCPDANIKTIYNGINPDSIPNAPDIPLDLKGVIQGKLVIFCACFMYERKNVPLLVKAFDVAAESTKEAVLVIAGDGPDYNNVVSAVENSKHKDRIHIIGRVEHKDILSIMLISDVFASFGVNEPFATTFIEAMGCGCPIIYCSDGGICEVVQDGIHGFSIPPNDLSAGVAAITKLLINSKLRTKMGSNGRLLVADRLTWQRNVQTIFSEVGLIES
ncbi:glycosyltransferase family 4 protein [Aquabacterium sp.]|uniref:glycosyltransferase family 4 protein n=1 Tax=Aquabacterium sp. TaxID=1872578 RepID=UPI0035AEF860